MVDPGTYTVKISVGQKQVGKPAVVEEDTRITVSAADRAARREAIVRVGELNAAAARSQQTVSGLQTALSAALEAWKRPDAPKVPDDIKLAAGELLKKAGEINGLFVQPRPRLWLGSSSPPQVYPPTTILQKISRLEGIFEGLTAAPEDPEKEALETISSLLEQTAAAVEKLVGVELAELNRKLGQAGVPVVRLPGS